MFEAVTSGGRVIATGTREFCECEAAWYSRLVGVVVSVRWL